MAGDWIKMRAELWTHPRFISLMNTLVFGDDPGILIYTCGDALGLDVFPPSDTPAVEKALRHVTQVALRDVTMCALLRVWCAVNAHCKVDGDDAICSPMILCDLDDIALFSGFGDALTSVGWVIQVDDNTLRFPNFCEFNEPACLRKRPKTNAERQREYRARHRDCGNGKPTHQEGVTKVTKRNDREEKRRDRSKKLRFLDSDHAEASRQWAAIQASNPTQKPPDLDAWADAIRLTREADHRSLEEIIALFDWAHRHHFWGGVILCPANLRKHWDKIQTQRSQGDGNGRTNAPPRVGPGQRHPADRGDRWADA